MFIRTVIFDFDGTLASSLEGIHACFAEALSRFGFAEPSADEVRGTVGLTLEESVRILSHRPCYSAQLGEVLDCYRALYKEKGRAMSALFPGAKAALLSIREMGVRRVLVSNKSHSGLCRMAEHLGIGADIDALHGIENGSFRKPDARL
ncbi:MAG: HAD family hydrolase, partial [Terriglobia bacterium]